MAGRNDPQLHIAFYENPIVTDRLRTKAEIVNKKCIVLFFPSFDRKLKYLPFYAKKSAYA